MSAAEPGMSDVSKAVEVLKAVCEGNFDKPGQPSYTDAHAALGAIRALAEQGEAQAVGEVETMHIFHAGWPKQTPVCITKWYGPAPKEGTKLYTHPAPQPVAEKVRVTEVMVERACKAFDPNCGMLGGDSRSDFSADMRAALEAALAQHPVADGFVVPEGMALVPAEFVEKVKAAERAAHPRAAPQLLSEAVVILTAATEARDGR